jgi:AraC-like DNA-binding protein
MNKLQELSASISRHSGDGVTETNLAGVLLISSDAPTLPMQHVYEPSFALVAQGTKQTVLGDTRFEYRAMQYLIVTTELPMSGHVAQATATEPFLAMGMSLNPTEIAELLLDSPSKGHAETEPLGVVVSNVTPDLLDAARRLLRLLDHPEDASILAPMIRREILWRLLSGEQGAILRQIGVADSRLSRIGRAIRWIRIHYAQAIHTEDLARLAAMSVSSFHRHFRAVTAMTPLQYQKRIRLQEARARLIAAVDDVASIALQVGYDSPSQFNREYSRLFGAPPGRDAQRLRTASARKQSTV